MAAVLGAAAFWLSPLVHSHGDEELAEDISTKVRNSCTTLGEEAVKVAEMSRNIREMVLAMEEAQGIFPKQVYEPMTETLSTSRKLSAPYP